MSKKNLEIAAFTIIGIAILALWAWQTFTPQAPETKEAILRTPEVREVKIEEETSQYKISVSYPEFHNIGYEPNESRSPKGDPAREAAANNLMKQKVEQSIGDFKNAAKDAEDFIPEAKSEMEIKYEVVYLNPSIASIKMSEYTYIEGAAHPLGIYWQFNYNFKDNREITLADLFTPGSNYLSTLSSISRDSLENQLKENYVQESVEFGTAPEAGNFSVFFLDKDKLIIIFNVYQVTDYAAGHQTVEIPYDRLTGAINQEGLVKLVRE